MGEITRPQRSTRDFSTVRDKGKSFEGDMAELSRIRGTCVPDDSSPPLLVAAWVGRGTEIQELLLEGADVNIRAKGGATPLHCAAWRGNRAVADMLIRAGAIVNIRDEFGLSPLHHSIRNGHRDVQSLLVSAGATLSPFEMVSLNLEEEIRRSLDSNPLLVNEPNEDGETLLFRCSTVRMARLLLSRGARVNAADRDGFTPLHVAAMVGDYPLVEFLADNGADVNARAADGSTTVYRAWLNDEMDICHLLVNRGADVTQPQEMAADLLWKKGNTEKGSKGF